MQIYSNRYRMNSLMDSICDAVDEVLSSRGRTVDHAAVCDTSISRPSYQVSVARHVLLYALHDIYGWSYRGIAQRTGFGVRTVMRIVSAVRDLRFSDADYMEILRLVMERLYGEEYC